MKYYKFFLGLLFSIVFSISTLAFSPDWGGTGHRTIGEIAENHLNKRAKKKIAAILQGEGLALVSTFGDDIKSDRRFDKFYTWHYINIPFDITYENADRNPDGDLVSGIETCIRVIGNENSSGEDKAFYLKLLVHFIGDLHQPMHVGRKEDKGGNTIQVRWFDNGTNLHAVWDSRMINHYNMTYTELSRNSRDLSRKEIKSMQEGTLIDWVNETQEHAKYVYGTVEPGKKLGYSYMYENFHLVRSQLQLAGIRLAKVLNELFS